MIILDEFTYSFSPEEQVALDWFFKTYMKKMADSQFKIVIENMYNNWKDKLLLAKNSKEVITEF